MIHLNPSTAPLLITAGAALLALAAVLAATVLALRLGKVTAERDRYAHRAKAEAAAREAMARRTVKTYRSVTVAEMVHRINGGQPGAYHRPANTAREG